VSDPARPSRQATIPVVATPAAMALSADGALLAFSHRQGGVDLWDVAGYPRPHRRPPLPYSEHVADLAFNRDGTVLVTAGSDETVQLWRVDLPILVSTIPADAGDVTRVMFTPDDEALAVVTSRTAQVWDVAAVRRPRRRGRLAVTEPGPAALVDGGRTLAVAGNEGVLLLATDPVTPLRPWGRLDADVADLGPGREGELILSNQYTTAVWQVRQRPYAELTRRHGRLVAARVTSSGYTLYTAPDETRVSIWRVTG
jgi:hypothetical protein